MQPVLHVIVNLRSSYITN